MNRDKDFNNNNTCTEEWEFFIFFFFFNQAFLNKTFSSGERNRS